MSKKRLDKRVRHMFARDTRRRRLGHCGRVVEINPLVAETSQEYSWRVGTIFYGGSATPIHIEDRALAHLKVVIATKLRRSESFTLSWRHPADQPTGRSTLWLHPSIPLRFVFDEPEPPELNRQWIEDLAHSANTSGGIMLVAEYFEPDSADPPEPPDPVISVGKVEMSELSVDKLTVAGTELTTQPARNEQGDLDSPSLSPRANSQ